MRSEKYNHADHCVFLIQYHIVWCPKFRYNVLKPPVDAKLKEILLKICKEYGYEMKALEVMPDHIHLFVSTPQTQAPYTIVQRLKSRSAVMLFRAFPNLKKFYGRCGSMWSRGYFISSIGIISEEAVRKYIAEQKTKEA